MSVQTELNQDAVRTGLCTGENSLFKVASMVRHATYNVTYRI